MEELSDYFHLPEKQVAAKMGMCLTSLKKICRSHGITRWPFRKLKSLERTMKKMNEDSQQIGAMTTANASSPAREKSSPFASAVGSRASSRSPVQAATKETLGEASALATKPNRLSHVEAEDDSWPSCTVSGADMRQLVVKNWSTFWTVQNMRNHLLTALGGTSLRFSEDGCKAYLEFGNSLAAVQARTVCEQACAMLRERMEASVPDQQDAASEAVSDASASLQQQPSEGREHAAEEEEEAPAEAPPRVDSLRMQDVHGELFAQIGGGAPCSATLRPDTRTSWAALQSLGAPASFAPNAIAPPSGLPEPAPTSTGVPMGSPPVSLQAPGSSCSSHSVRDGVWSPQNHWAPTYISC